MAQSNRKFYRDNGAAAYDVYAWNDQAARQYEDGRCLLYTSDAADE